MLSPTFLSLSCSDIPLPDVNSEAASSYRCKKGLSGRKWYKKEQIRLLQLMKVGGQILHNQMED